MALAPSRLDKAPSPAAANNREMLLPHPMIRPGTKFLWDSREPLCHPTGAIVPGTAPNGTAFKTLVWPDSDGDFYGPAASIVLGGGAQWSVNANGSIKSPAYTVASYIGIGGAGEFDMSAAEYEYLATIWWQPPATGFTTGNYVRMFDLTTGNANFNQVSIDWGLGGRRPRGVVGVGGTTSIATGYPADRTWDGTPQQLAVHFRPGQRLDFFGNGVPIASVSSGVPSDLPAAATGIMKVLGVQSGDILGFSFTDLTASIAAEAAFGTRAADDIWTATQHVAADYAYGVGTRASAPSVGYA